MVSATVPTQKRPIPKQYKKFYSTGNGHIAILVYLENSATGEAELLDLVHDGSFKDMANGVRAVFPDRRWQIVETWDIIHESLNDSPRYV